MGGSGSGRRHQGGRGTTSDCRALDVRRLQRDGFLKPWRAFGWNWSRDGKTIASIQIRTEDDRLILNYRCRSWGGDWEQKEYPVRLNWTACTLGGKRAWFLCPASGCGRRVALLYLGDSKIFACRHCNRLAYACQRESDTDRIARRAEKIRDRLGWKAGILNRNGGRPKGMHWRTYARLTSEHNTFASAAFAGIALQLGLVRKRLGSVHDALRRDS